MSPDPDPESHLFNKKYGRGRNLKRAIWVCLGISRVTKNAFIITTVPGTIALGVME
jgi:hypothetical protein